jgi:uncharacterized protein
MIRNPPRAWQRMLSGRRLDLLDPSPVDIELTDIAHGLARVARWNGQTRGDAPFSVAQHSVLVLELFIAQNAPVSPDNARIALLHDAPEYVMGDIISPFKTVMGGHYRDVEARLLRAVHLRFALPAEAPSAIAKAIKRADKQAAFFEAVELAGFEREEALRFFGEPGPLSLSPERLRHLLSPWPTREAQALFSDAFTALSADH